MKKTAVVILALALLVTFAAVPVMAEPTKGQKVPVKEYTTGIPTLVPPTLNWTTKGGIWQFRGEQEFFTDRLVIGNPPYTSIDFHVTIVGDGSWNTKTGLCVVHYDCVWTLAGDGSNGFSGNVEMRLYDFDLYAGTWSWWSAHEVAQGFGDFAGQTLMLSMDGPMATIWTGYLLKG